MPYESTFHDPEILAENDNICVWQAYKDEEWYQPLHFWVIVTPQDTEPENVEDEYDTIDLRELGYEGEWNDDCTPWIEANMDKLEQAMTRLDEDEDEDEDEVMIHEFGGKYFLYFESGQLADGDFLTAEEAKRVGEEQGWKVVESFNLYKLL